MHSFDLILILNRELLGYDTPNLAKDSRLDHRKLIISLSTLFKGALGKVCALSASGQVGVLKMKRTCKKVQEIQ